ncbi:MAG TPA: ABC transporter permease subunit, partial [Candidatus Acidoferrales bacterium]|nr:ABC transporter permease subunit [Candidatus Acidoferrales bacterium]
AGGAPALWVLFFLILLAPIAFFLLVAVVPAAVGQGSSWFTLAPFIAALSGPTLQGLVDSLALSASTAILSLAIALLLAWLVQRTNLRARVTWNFLIWVVLLTPSFLVALGWERLLQPEGVLADLGWPVAGLSHIFFSPLGVVFVDTTKGVPFAFLAISAALGALGREYEDAARIHGGGRATAIRTVLPILAPAMWSALAIVFAETISDFGVASTIANTANFPVATMTLFNAVDNFPVNFPVAAAVGWLLVASIGLALFAQSRALRGRSYQVLSGRSRASSRLQLSRRGQTVGIAVMVLFFGLTLGVPAIAVASASLLKPTASAITLNSFTLNNYVALAHHPSTLGPIGLSTALALVATTLAVGLGLIVARILTRRRSGASARILDLLLLATVGLPGILLGAGYIFVYNLPALATVGLRLYGTLFLLDVAYLANTLPITARLLSGPMAQIQFGLHDAARVHGRSALGAWRSTVVPLLSRTLLWAWLFGFAGLLFELPISQLLYPPGQEPLSVAITAAFANFSYAPGTTLMVASVAYALAVVGLALLGFRLLAPKGWQRVGVAR